MKNISIGTGLMSVVAGILIIIASNAHKVFPLEALRKGFMRVCEIVPLLIVTLLV